MDNDYLHDRNSDIRSIERERLLWLQHVWYLAPRNHPFEERNISLRVLQNYVNDRKMLIVEVRSVECLDFEWSRSFIFQIPASDIFFQGSMIPSSEHLCTGIDFLCSYADLQCFRNNHEYTMHLTDPRNKEVHLFVVIIREQ